MPPRRLLHSPNRTGIVPDLARVAAPPAPPAHTRGVQALFRDSLLSADDAVALLRHARDDLESSAGVARVLAADMNWQSDAVRHVHDRIDGIERGLAALAADADDAIADVIADRRRHLEALALLGP